MTDAERARELLRESGEIIRSLCQDTDVRESNALDTPASLEAAMKSLAAVMSDLAAMDEERSRRK